MKKNIFLWLIAISHAIILSVPKIERQTIDSISNIKSFITARTLFILDIDDTLIYDDEHSRQGIVEPETLLDLFDIIKRKSCGALAITARNTTADSQRFTQEQLKHFNLNFSSFFPDDSKKNINCILLDDYNKAYYMNGIIFVEGTNKGKALEAFLSYFSTRPERIIVVDDKSYNLDDVTAVFKENNSFPELKKIILCDYPYVKNQIL